VRIFDTLIYSGMGTEDDLLECRLRELDDAGIYQHVIVEGSLTHQGRPKPLNFLERADRFAPWKERIRYIPIEPSADVPGRDPGPDWAREHSSRMGCWQGLYDAEPDDLILHGDVDEIPSREVIASLREHAAEIVPCKLQVRFFMFAVDWEVPWPWFAPSVAKIGQLSGFTFTDLRYTGWPVYPHVNPAGWHLTWLGGEEAAREKVHAFSHREAIYETEAGLAAGKYYTQGVWWPGGGRPHETQFDAVEVDGTWPEWIHRSWDADRQQPVGPAPAIWFRPR
jgi:beta-1,4-mannosyl-glycoprotein beta-1,4-N-acetylglucosaminyltransferase